MAKCAGRNDLISVVEQKFELTFKDAKTSTYTVSLYKGFIEIFLDENFKTCFFFLQWAFKPYLG